MPVPKRAKAALPDPGTTVAHEVVASTDRERRDQSARRAASCPTSATCSAACASWRAPRTRCWSRAAKPKGGAPVAVFGPQVSYFTPQILLEFEIHAPGGPTGPPLDARGAAFPGTNLYVQLGHGRDYAWSATSAAQDIIDTFAVKLCEADGSKPTLASMSYRFRGECLPIDVLERVNSWTQSPGDTTPSGSETYRAERTALGIVTHRAEIKGKPYAFTKLRATYYHEVDSALGFADFNNPEKMESPEEFMEAACKIQYTFNWFFIDSEQIAYFNSGINPVRVDARPSRPADPREAQATSGRASCRRRRRCSPARPIDQTNVDPRTNFSAQEPCEAHPQIVDQS